MEFTTIDYKTACDFLLPRHYSGRVPNIMYAFGWYSNGKLKAVCTFGKPASNSLCVGVCGKKYANRVIELNRLCRVGGFKKPLSKFVALCLRSLRDNLIIVSYADEAMGHNGYIYQACNFIYTGKTKKRTDKYTNGNKHSRHYDKNMVEVYRKVRSAKHRYIYFACPKRGSMKKEFIKSLNYKPIEYPKGQNKKYKLGFVLEPEIIKVK